MKNSKVIAETPIFFEALGAAAKCNAFDAAEHFDGLLAESREHPVERFLEDYAGG